LLGFDRLNGAVIALQEDAFSIGSFYQGQPAPIRAQARIGLDKIKFGKAEETRQIGDFRVRELHLPRPPATGRAALAFIKNRHAPV
jgi:hypothetical protein